MHLPGIQVELEYQQNVKPIKERLRAVEKDMAAQKDADWTALQSLATKKEAIVCTSPLPPPPHQTCVHVPRRRSRRIRDPVASVASALACPCPHVMEPVAHGHPRAVLR